MKASPPVIPAYTLEAIEKIFNIQKANQYAVASSSARERIEKLNKFHRVFLHYRPAIKEALFLDFHKHPFEVDLTEIYTVTSELKHATRNLRRWMSKHRTSTPLSLL